MAQQGHYYYHPYFEDLKTEEPALSHVVADLEQVSEPRLVIEPSIFFMAQKCVCIYICIFFGGGRVERLGEEEIMTVVNFLMNA